ncbi:NEDD4-binding protein 1-like isoform X2 [Drosophila serrata]|nr:NEDD4-binding protein 1-like isoform X2 [Drosophila serrata]
MSAEATEPLKKFKKFKDNLPKNTPKRLQHKAKHNMNFDRNRFTKLMSSIKKKYNVKKNPQVQRKFELLRNSPTKNLAVPKPKIFTPQQKITSDICKIEEGEIIETSDDDDCVLLETTNVPINLDEDESDTDTEPFSSDKFFKACQRRAEKLATPKIIKDSRRDLALLMKPKSDHELLYSTITKSESSSDNACIDLLESPKSMPMPIENNDDSVILLEDSIGGEDFIPLHNPLAKNATKLKTQTPKKASKISNKKSGRMSLSQFSSADKKKVGDYSRNTFNATEETDGPGQASGKLKSNKRSIIIDGSNVAFAHGNSNLFSSEGIKYCLQYFDKMGHNAKAVMPSFRRNAFKSSNPELLDQLHKEGKVVFTPCKNIPGQKSISYDDRFILQLAYEWNAAVVSNDNYRDLIDESPAFKKIVETRVLGYTWCDNIFILPKDPYGRWGPTLDEILRC